MFSNLRIGGLASGIDIDSIMKDLMKAYRLPLQKLEQEKQLLEWKQEDFRQINTTLRSFRNLVFNMKLQSTYLAKRAMSADESVVEVSATSSAVEGSYAISVKQLAEPACITSTDSITIGDKTTLAKQLGISGTQDLTIRYQYTDKDGSIKTISNTFTVDDDKESIYDLINKINTYKPDSGEWKVRASYDPTFDRMVLMTTVTGEDQYITVSDNSLARALKLTSGTDTTGQGRNAKYDLTWKLPNLTLNDQTSPTNTFTVNGITFSLKKTTYNPSTGSYDSIDVSVSSDTDTVFKSIVDFVNEYNKVIEAITGELYEPRYRDYMPLTDEQREQLTDDQIDKWIEKARSGLLRNDPVLYAIYSKMRLTMSAMVPTGGSYTRLAGIGITTTSDYMSGKLVVDEEKLRQAIEKDPQGVMELFIRDPDSGEYSEMGIARRLYEDVVSGMDRISRVAGGSGYSLVDNSEIGKQIRRLEDEIKLKEDRLKTIEDRYWKQFTAMEEAIQRMNAQSVWLSMQLGIGTTK